MYCDKCKNDNEMYFKEITKTEFACCKCGEIIHVCDNNDKKVKFFKELVKLMDEYGLRQIGIVNPSEDSSLFFNFVDKEFDLDDKNNIFNIDVNNNFINVANKREKIRVFKR